MPYTPLTPRAEGEPLPEYAARVLRHVITYGPDLLDPSDLDMADRAAQAATASLPAYLDPDTARLDATLHTLRARIARRLETHRAGLRTAQRALDALYATPDDAQGMDAQSPDAPPQTADERAVRLLKAALVLVMGPKDDRNGPGSPAKLIPPRPTLPHGGIALDRPTQTPDVQF